MSKLDKITCRCGKKFGILVSVAGEVEYQTRCRHCKRIVSVRITPTDIDVQIVAVPLMPHRPILYNRTVERRYPPA